MTNTNLISIRLLLILLIFAVVPGAMSQKTIDSLNLELLKTSDTSRVRILNQLSVELKHIDPEQALGYAGEAINLSSKISYKEGEAKGFINSGNVYRKLGEFNKAIEAYLEGLGISQAANNVNGIARSYNGLGIAYNLLGDYDKSLESFLNALKTYEDDNDLEGTANALNNVGVHYLFLGIPEQALDYYLRALEIRRSIGHTDGIAASLNNIGDVYADMENSDNALKYFLEALNLVKNEGTNDLIFALQNNIGLHYGYLNDHNKAIEHYNHGLDIADKLGDNWGKSMTYKFLGISYMELGNYNTAEQYLNKSLDLGRQIESKAVVRDAFKNLSELYFARNDHKRSLEYYKSYTEIKDSILNETTNEQMAEMRTRFETEKKEAEINELIGEKTIQDLKLKKSEILKWFFIVISLLIFMLAGLVYYGFRQKQKSNRLLKERNKLEIENKKRAISLFGQQVSKEVAMELLTNTNKSTGKKLFACIMFLDIRGFTPFAEKLEPIEIIKFQNDVFGFMIDIVIKYHGIINQFLGDGFMATFGAPASSGNDCQNAVNAAMEIVTLLKKKCEAGNLPETKVGIGLHAGHIVTGNVGTSERKQYSITGNTVILASRIEQLNKKHDSAILISKDVLNNLDESALDVTSLGEEYLKGRAEPMEIFKLL